MAVVVAGLRPHLRTMGIMFRFLNKSPPAPMPPNIIVVIVPPISLRLLNAGTDRCIVDALRWARISLGVERPP